MQKRKALALIAHDSRKEDLVRIIKSHKAALAEFELIATRDTGQLIQARTGMPVTLLQNGALGGDLQIGALVVNGEVNGVIFYRDPLKVLNHEPDVFSIMRVCDIYSVPLATNFATAEAIIHILLEHPESLNEQQVTADYLENFTEQRDQF